MLRRTSTARLLISIFAALAIAGAVGAVTALAVDSGSALPPAAPLADAIHDALKGPPLNGFSADITLTDNLLPSANVGADSGIPLASSPLLTGASGRLWASADGRLRFELQASNGDTEILVTPDAVTLEDVASNSVYELALPASSGATGATGATGASGAGEPSQVPTVATIQSALEHLMGAVDLSGAEPTNVAGVPAYSVTIAPKHPAGLLGEARLAWDAVRGIPLDVAIYARNSSSPVLELKLTAVSYGPVDPGVFALAPPPGAHVQRITAAASQSSAGRGTIVKADGFAATSAAVPFALDAPATLGGLSRTRVLAIGWNSKPAALALYGQGFGSVAVFERASSGGGSQNGGPLGALGALPRVALGGVSGSELQTALGTAIEFSRAGVDYVVAGFVTPATVEAVARGL
jgi:hypothetical protein